MALLRLALIVQAKRELTLSAEEVPIGGPRPDSLEVVDERLDTLEGPLYRKVGVTTVSQVFLTGAEIADLANPADSLSLSWYLPGEEGPEMAKSLDVTQVGLLPQNLDLEPPSPGREWWRKVEARGPITETLFFESGFQPPFKSSQVTLYLTDLRNLGVTSFILSQVMYGHRVPAYTEGEWGFSELVSEGRLT
ncbi:MAG: hypothetical protein LBR11_11450 [Deltaproteobacteria bacterium]|jgi:hypothetical protein|nr:hypothetical protein [Deltaproteobacteria bacterium]